LDLRGIYSQIYETQFALEEELLVSGEVKDSGGRKG